MAGEKFESIFLPQMSPMGADIGRRSSHEMDEMHAGGAGIDVGWHRLSAECVAPKVIVNDGRMPVRREPCEVI